jgi:hypothetical protein
MWVIYFRPGPGAEGDYIARSGTPVAAPIVAYALLFQQSISHVESLADCLRRSDSGHLRGAPLFLPTCAHMADKRRPALSRGIRRACAPPTANPEGRQTGPPHDPEVCAEP